MDQVGVVAILLGVVLAIVVLWRRLIRAEQRLERLADVESGLRSIREHLIHEARKGGEPYRPRPLLYEPETRTKEF